MNAIKVAYIVCSTVLQLAYLALMVLAPIYLTPGYYWWSFFAFVLMILSSEGVTLRLNSWDNMELYKND